MQTQKINNPAAEQRGIRPNLWDQFARCYHYSPSANRN